MHNKKILFPTDFSTCSDAGIEQATVLAREAGATLLFVHVEEPPLIYGDGEMYYGAIEPDHEALTKMLKALVPTDPSVPCEHRLLRGDPARSIVELAEQERCDLIIMGTHGRTGMTRLVMGSVAEGVMRRAKCPVLTYKQRRAAPAKKAVRAER